MEIGRPLEEEELLQVVEENLVDKEMGLWEKKEEWEGIRRSGVGSERREWWGRES